MASLWIFPLRGEFGFSMSWWNGSASSRHHRRGEPAERAPCKGKTQSIRDIQDDSSKTMADLWLLGREGQGRTGRNATLEK
jgi:hypothetical protein